MGTLSSSGGHTSVTLSSRPLWSLKLKAAQIEWKEGVCPGPQHDLQKQAASWWLGLPALLPHTSNYQASATGPTPIQAVRVTDSPESLTYQQKQQKKHQNPLGIHKDKEVQPSQDRILEGKDEIPKCNHRTSLATFQPESFRETKGSSTHTHTHTFLWHLTIREVSPTN